MHAVLFRVTPLALLASFIAALALSAPASATPSKPYALVICALGTSETCAPSPASATDAPAAVPASSTSVPMTATFKNENKSGSGIQLGSVNLTPPAGFTVSNPSVSGCATCATVVGNVVQLRGLAIPAGGSVTLGMTVDDSSAPACLVPNRVPNPTNSPTCAWSAIVKQSNDFSGQPGNDLGLNPATSAPYVALAHLDFSTQPASAVFGQPITSNAFAPGSAVALDVVDANGTLDLAYHGQVTLGLHQGTTPEQDTTTAQLNGGALPAVGGVASFPDLTVSAPGIGYALTGHADQLPPDTNRSHQFDTAQTGEPCGSAKACATLDAATSDFGTFQGIDAKVSSNANPNSAAASLVESTDFGTRLTASQCEGYVANHQAFFDLKAPGGNADRALTASITTTQLSGTVSGSMINGQDDCLATVNHPFLEHIEGTNTTGPAMQTTLASGDIQYTGLLPDCGTKAGQVDPAIWPCVKNRSGTSSKVGNGTLTITISVPPNFGDPTHSG